VQKVDSVMLTLLAAGVIVNDLPVATRALNLSNHEQCAKKT
jgi:hypothetical protein